MSSAVMQGEWCNPPRQYELENVAIGAMEAVRTIVHTIHTNVEVKFGRSDTCVGPQKDNSHTIPVEIRLFFQTNIGNTTHFHNITLAVTMKRLIEDHTIFSVVFDEEFIGMIDGQPIVVRFRKIPGYHTIPEAEIVSRNGVQSPTKV
jgi:hypothetical protein